MGTPVCGDEKKEASICFMNQLYFFTSLDDTIGLNEWVYEIASQCALCPMLNKKCHREESKKYNNQFMEKIWSLIFPITTGLCLQRGEGVKLTIQIGNIDFDSACSAHSDAHHQNPSNISSLQVSPLFLENTSRLIHDHF